MTQPVSTLPDQLLAQARQRGQQTALRHKQLGIWQERSWRSIADETGRLAGALAARGFVAGDALTLLSHPRAEALLLSLAAQWLGGIAVPLDPALPDKQLITLLQQIAPRFLFLEDEVQVARSHAAGLAAATTIYAAARGLADHRQLTSYATLADEAAQSVPSPKGRAEQTAFAFYRLLADGSAEREQLSHAELLQEGQRLVSAEQLSHREEALAARAFAAGGQARYLLAPWLLAGFRLNFPENLATRDNDRRELGPTLVAGTRETWGRLALQVQQRLPEAGSWRRAWIDAVVKTGHDHAATPSWFSRLLARSVGHWLIRKPLRDVLGLTRTRVPLLVGEPLPEHVAAFFASLGLTVRTWPDPAQWQGLITGARDAQRISGWAEHDGTAVQPG
ncbi:2-succinylbenzoate--CoA ligase [Andreprevotia sp. IGB-42]|uniref:AMP-binding protein n=1 Tax=Andreprevotia sp. IGB-42 TaxID=2497473 RepID=UPI001356E3A2|nr:AMP-binding protein [Andreprevotia sp. IGB-42]KAF0815314.1 2-succinylbenzoate--CoA ligase [Andreprevotia sp. IGB-42]